MRFEYDNSKHNRRKFFGDLMSMSPIYTDRLLANKIFSSQINEKKEPFNIKKNQILIGFNSTDFNENSAVLLNLKFKVKVGDEFEKRSRVITIIGKKGSGKSMLKKVISENIKYRMHMPFFFIDPYGEDVKMKEKYAEDKSLEYQEYIDEFLSKFGLERQNMNIIVISPKFLGELQNVDKYYSISYTEFRDMAKYDLDLAVTIMSELLGIDNNDDNIELLMNVINNKTIETWKDMYNMLIREKKNLKTKTHKIFGRVISRLRNQIITDDTSITIDIKSLLMKYDAVVFRARLRDSVDDSYTTKMYNAYVKMIISQIRIDITRFINGDETATIKCKEGVFIPIDEADSLAPASGISSLRNTIVQLATKFRKSMISLILITQSVEKLDHTLMAQSDFILTAKLDDINRGIISERNVSKEEIETKLTNLRSEQKTSIGTIVNEWAFIDDENNITLFYPTIPLTNNKR